MLQAMRVRMSCCIGGAPCGGQCVSGSASSVPGVKRILRSLHPCAVQITLSDGHQLGHLLMAEELGHAGLQGTGRAVLTGRRVGCQATLMRALATRQLKDDAELADHYLGPQEGAGGSSEDEEGWEVDLAEAGAGEGPDVSFRCGSGEPQDDAQEVESWESEHAEDSIGEGAGLEDDAAEVAQDEQGRELEQAGQGVGGVTDARSLSGSEGPHDGAAEGAEDEERREVWHTDDGVGEGAGISPRSGSGGTTTVSETTQGAAKDAAQETERGAAKHAEEGAGMALVSALGVLLIGPGVAHGVAPRVIQAGKLRVQQMAAWEEQM